MPSTSDHPSMSQRHMNLEPLPDIPEGSQYSPSRKKWRSPSGAIFDAGAFAPLPLDRNTIDSQDFMSGNAPGWPGRFEDI